MCYEPNDLSSHGPPYLKMQALRLHQRKQKEELVEKKEDGPAGRISF